MIVIAVTLRWLLNQFGHTGGNAPVKGDDFVFSRPPFPGAEKNCRFRKFPVRILTGPVVPVGGGRESPAVYEMFEAPHQERKFFPTVQFWYISENLTSSAICQTALNVL